MGHIAGREFPYEMEGEEKDAAAERQTNSYKHPSSKENPGCIKKFLAAKRIHDINAAKRIHDIHGIVKALFNTNNLRVDQSSNVRTSQTVPPDYEQRLQPLLCEVIKSRLPASWTKKYKPMIHDLVMLVSPPKHERHEESNRPSKLYRHTHSGHENDPDGSEPVLCFYLVLGKVSCQGEDEPGDDGAEKKEFKPNSRDDPGSLRVWKRSHKVLIHKQPHYFLPTVKENDKDIPVPEFYEDLTGPFGTLICTDTRLLRQFRVNQTDYRRIFLQFFVQPRNGTRKIENSCEETVPRLKQR